MSSLTTANQCAVVIILTSLHGLAASARADGEAEPRRLAVSTPRLALPGAGGAGGAGGVDDALACAAYVLADGLSEALSGRVANWEVLDRRLVRALEREGAPLEGALVIEVAPTLGTQGIEARVAGASGLEGRSFSAADAPRLFATLADAIVPTLAGAARPSRASPPFPSAPKVCAALARAHARFDPGDPAALADAGKHLAAAARMAPDEPRVLALQAELKLRQGDVAAGAELAERLAALTPEWPEAQWVLGLAHDYADRTEPALAAYQRAAPDVAAAAVNGGLVALRAGRLAAALPLLEAAVARAPGWSIARLNLAAALLEAGDGPAARGALERPVAARLSNERNLLMARALLLGGDGAAALALLDPVLARADASSTVRGLHATALAMVDPARGLEAIAPLLASPGVADASRARMYDGLLVARARALARSGRTAEAIAQLAERARSDPELTRPLVHRALALLGDDGPARLTALVARRPDDHEAWYDLGVLRERAGDLAGAAEAYERSAAMNPRASWARYNRGRLALSQGDARRAVDWLEAAARLDASAHDIAAALAAARAQVP